MIETNKFVTYKEISEIINQLEDYRDKVIIMLIFDGFYTKMDDIQNLTVKDLDERSKRRFLAKHEISGVTTRVIHKALEEKQIHTFSAFNNGLDELIPSDYIVRERKGFINRSGENFNGFAMNKQSIINRFSRAKRHYGFSFTLSSLYASGVIHRGLQGIARDERHRVNFLKKIEKEEGVNRGMGYVYYRAYLEMLPRIEQEEKEMREGI